MRSALLVESLMSNTNLRIKKIPASKIVTGIPTYVLS